MLAPLVVAGISLLLAGWILAFRARGKFLEIARSRSYWQDRAKIAEAKLDVQRQRADDAEISCSAAIAQQSVIEVELASARNSLSRCQADRESALDELAKSSIGKSTDHMDSTIRRLLQNRHRRPTTP